MKRCGLFFALMFVLCPVVWAQTATSDLRGIYVYSSDVAQISAAYSRSVTAALNLPGTDGIVLVIGWKSLEPAMGQYQWSTLDRWIGQAISSGKKIELAVTPGSDTPSWLFQPAPIGAGAAPLNFTISPHAGATGICDAETIAAPWDPAFLSRWDSLVAALAAHLQSAGTYGAIALIRLTGINRTTDELRLPAETPESTGLACVSDAVSIWQRAGYRPSLLLQGWDKITGSFQKSFPDKSFSVAIIPQNPFPRIAEDGSIIKGTLPDENQPLLLLASQKLPHRLVVQFNFLMPGEPASTAVIQAAQTLGTLAAFQTNEYFGSTGQGAACSEPVTNPTPCTAATFLTMLQTGIYPLGQGNNLRAQYIEVFPANANAFPDDIQQAHLALLTQVGFTIANRGGASLISRGATGSVSVGYGEIQANVGNTTPSGVAIFGFRQNNILVSEVGVPASPAVTAGRIYAEIAGAVDAGLAIANPNNTAASISFYFTDGNGNPSGSGTATIGANQQIAQFLDQSPFKVYSTSTFQGTFSFTSSAPIAVVALRGFTNERGDFLMSTLPVIDPTVAPNTGTAVVPHFVDGGGWITQVFLVNPTDNPMSGTIQFVNPAGTPETVTIGSHSDSSFSYSVAKRTSQKLSTSGLAAGIASGSIRIVPADGGAGPTALILFSYKPAGATVSEAGVPVTSGNAFRGYVESSGVPGQLGSIESGIAVANTTSTSLSVTFDISDLTGSSITGIAPVAITLPAAGQTAKFLSDIFPFLPKPFKGVLRVTGTSGLSVVGLRTRVNERGDFLITTTPASNENSSSTATQMFFPQVADGGGYTTQFVLFSGTAGQASAGILNLVKQDGSFFGLALN